MKDALTMAIFNTLKHLLHALTASGGRETGLCEGMGGREGEGRGGRGGRERERRGGRVTGTGTGKRGAEGGKGEGGKGEGGKGED